MPDTTPPKSTARVELMLKKAGIRSSAVRTLVMRSLLEAGRPMSTLEIEDKLQTVDRSSITRALGIFASHHIIHQISDGSGAMRYEICNDLSSVAHNDEHAHFHCKRCGLTYCLSDMPISLPELPLGFSAEYISYVIHGTCPDCGRQ